MIFIISINGENSTNSVINWLIYNNVSFYRINFDDFFSRKIDISITPSDRECILKINNTKFSQTDIDNSVIWCRKLASFQRVNHTESLKSKLDSIYSHIEREYSKFCDSLLHVFSESQWLCNHNAKYLNKYYALQCALKNGLDIPDTILTNNKNDLINFNKVKLSTKCIGDGLSISIKDNDIRLLSTTLLTNEDIIILPEHFMPSMTQKYIEKFIELRIMYINKKTFTTALFSQENESTKIDFRIITKGEKHCRMVPYTLPKVVEEKIINLMSDLDLNTGSIDMILGSDGKYYFLEVNPAGQYSWVSNNCNYNIDEYIAKTLIKMSDERKSTAVAY